MIDVVDDGLPDCDITSDACEKLVDSTVAGKSSTYATYAEVCPEAVVDGLPPFVYGVAHGINTWCDTQLARMATEKAAEEAEKASQEEAEAPEEYEETPEGSGGESEDEESSATIGVASSLMLASVTFVALRHV